MTLRRRGVRRAAGKKKKPQTAISIIISAQCIYYINKCANLTFDVNVVRESRWPGAVPVCVCVCWVGGGPGLYSMIMNISNTAGKAAGAHQVPRRPLCNDNFTCDDASILYGAHNGYSVLITIIERVAN